MGGGVHVTHYPHPKFTHIALLYCFFLKILKLFSDISCTFSLAVIISDDHQHADF